MGAGDKITMTLSTFIDTTETDNGTKTAPGNEAAVTSTVQVVTRGAIMQVARVVLDHQELAINLVLKLMCLLEPSLTTATVWLCSTSIVELQTSRALQCL